MVNELSHISARVWNQLDSDFKQASSFKALKDAHGAFLPMVELNVSFEVAHYRILAKIPHFTRSYCSKFGFLCRHFSFCLPEEQSGDNLSDFFGPEQ